jgi:NADH:ubiquinone oxidoreductase subunit 4 (subunit M)
MRKIWNKGHRIRASDKHLVYHFSIGTLLFVFVAVLLLLNSKQLMRTDWEHFSLLENGLTLCPYNFITILIATGVCALYGNSLNGTSGGTDTGIIPPCRLHFKS